MDLYSSGGWRPSREPDLDRTSRDGAVLPTQSSASVTTSVGLLRGYHTRPSLPVPGEN